MKNTLKIAAMLTSVIVLASACGDDTGGGADAALVQAIIDDVMADDDAPPGQRDEIECYVRNVANNLGDTRLAELGVTTSNVQPLDELDLSDTETAMVVDELFDCLDVRALMAEQMAEDFGEEDAKCLADKLDEDTLKGFFGASFTGEDPPDIFAEVLALMSECGIDPTG